MDIQEKMREKITAILAAATEKAQASEELPLTEELGAIKELIRLEEPKDKTHGDFACNIAMLLAKPMRRSPGVIANAVVANMEKTEDIEKVEVAGAGFINFYLNSSWLYEVIQQVELQGDDYGRVNIGNGKRVMVEFVSANPTGPMHMGNARGGALGDCLAAVLEHAGYDVTREFYINDAGNQIEKFASSLNARYIQQLKGDDAIEFPEDGYHGDDIKEHAKNFIAVNGDKYLDCDENERKDALVGYALEKI